MSVPDGTLTLRSGDVTAEFIYESLHERDLLWWMEDIENELLAEIIEELTPSDVFYDIGANIGVISCLAGTQLESGLVVAFEPYPPNSSRLANNLSRNLPSERYHVVPKAIADTTGTIPFAVPDDGGPSTQVGHIATNGSELSVPVISGDEFVSNTNVPPPTVVKIDVEGAEGAVLDGFEETLSSDICRVLYLEAHLEKPSGDRPGMDAFGISPRDIRSTLSDLGFEIVDRRRRQTEFHVKAVRRS